MKEARNTKDKSRRIDFLSQRLKRFLHSYEELKNGKKSPKYDDKFIINVHKALTEIRNNIELFNAVQGSIPLIDWESGDFYAKILIGGIGLERGYTIQGLTISYVVRESGTDDTVYQNVDFWISQIVYRIC